MPKAAEHEKLPIQARSAVTVDAILQATLQVLQAVGKERLTTTLVAARAGVSVGTLYQYFPNKMALLQACLRHHMDGVYRAIARMCEQHRNTCLLQMGTALVAVYMEAKMQDMQGSLALYAVSADVDGAAISKAISTRSQQALAGLFATATQPLAKPPDVMATIVFAALHGVARRMLEAASPPTGNAVPSPGSRATSAGLPAHLSQTGCSARLISLAGSHSAQHMPRISGTRVLHGTVASRSLWRLRPPTAATATPQSRGAGAAATT